MIRSRTVRTLWAFGGCIALLTIWPRSTQRPFVVLNRSQSLSCGLYIRTSDPPVRGSLIEFRNPTPNRPWIDAHMFVHANGAYFLKPIEAGPGDHVDSLGSWLFVDGEKRAPMTALDTTGRCLPVWRARRHLAADEFFVLSTRVPNSLDSRHFGPIKRAEIECVRRPLWVWE